MQYSIYKKNKQICQQKIKYNNQRLIIAKIKIIFEYLYKYIQITKTINDNQTIQSQLSNLAVSYSYITVSLSKYIQNMNDKIVLSCTLLVTLVMAKNGLTWGLASGNAGNNWIGSVGCGPGNPYNGDTDCEAYLPILCITNHKLLPQPSSFVCPIPERPCWAGGIFTTTIPIRGADITKKDVADNQCKRQFGPNSKMAEHHDAWGWVSNGYVLSTWTGRAWTWINDQPNGNCGTL